MSRNYLRVTHDCPYCSGENSTVVEGGKWAADEIVTCDTEIGGCGKEYVVKITMHSAVERYELKNVKDA